MTKKRIQIRETKNNDFENIMIVEERAFGSDKEAKLTADLLNDETARPFLSLLAFEGKKAVGHIIFTRGYINEMDSNQPLIHILAPLAIIPEYQKQGIGGLLIREGLKRLKEMGSEMVFVLGHIDYYPRFDFIPDAKKLGYTAPFPIPEEFADAWMVQSLNSVGFVIEKGKVICANALNKEEHWRE
jgi:putative acetyltransferase